MERWSDADGRGCAEVTYVSGVERNGRFPDAGLLSHRSHDQRWDEAIPAQEACPPVKPEGGMFDLETLLGLGGILLFQPFQNRLVCFFRLFLLDPMTAIQTDHFRFGHELC